MNAAEVLQLCRMVKAFCPSQQFDQYTPDAWALILGDHPFEDARAAVVAIASAELAEGKSRYIEPGHIIGGIKRIRGKRLDATPIPAPPAHLETAAEQIEWQRQVREQIAAGMFVTPDAPKELARDVSWREMVPDVDQHRPGVAAKDEGRKFRATHEQRSAIDDEAAERERVRQLAALDALTKAGTVPVPIETDRPKLPGESLVQWARRITETSNEGEQQ